MKTTSVKFCKNDSLLYQDETVTLSDATYQHLVSELHLKLGGYKPQSNAPIRDPNEHMPQSDSPYEQDYQKVHKRLSQISWQQFDLPIAAFLMGYRGCLGVNEILAMTPFFLEMMLRADDKTSPENGRMPEPFGYILNIFRKPKKKEEQFELQKLYDDLAIRSLIIEVFTALKKKYPFQKELDRILRDWSGN